LIFVFGIIGAVIAYIVFSIMALVNNPERVVHERCPDSNMWAYVLTVLIVGFVMGRNAKNQVNDDTATRFFASLVQLCISIGLGTWGAMEVWGSDCAQKKLSSLLIYKMAEIMTSLNLTVSILCIIAVMFLLFMVCYMKDEDDLNISSAETDRVDALIAQMEAQNNPAKTNRMEAYITGGAPPAAISDNLDFNKLPAMDAVVEEV
jgi:NAD/NADP transhydrogenase beta subunit